MNFNELTITTSEDFIRSLKKLSKKYPSLKQDLTEFKKSILSDPLQGISLGQNCYKVRHKITSKGKGKSGGGQVITFVRLSYNRIILLEIYNKSEKESISETELADLIKRNN